MSNDILLVDDEPKNLYALSALLESLDVNVVQAGSGEEALRRLLERDFAAILLDVRLPGMDGFEIAALIRSRSRTRDTPILFLSALSDPRNPSQPLDDYLLKPLDPEILLAKVAGRLALFRRRPTTL